jgi:vitamin B12 transporter
LARFDGQDGIAAERIEIASGPGSVLFGSDAVTGSINTVTKKGSGKPTVNYQSSYGTGNQTRNQLEFSGQTGKLSFTAAASRHDRPDHRWDNSDNLQHNWAIRLDYDLDESTKSYAKYVTRGSMVRKGYYESSYSGYGPSVEPIDGNDRSTVFEMLHGLELGSTPFKMWSTTMKFGYFEACDGFNVRALHEGSNLYDPPWKTQADQKTDFTQRRYSWDWNNNLHLVDMKDYKFTLSLGAADDYETLKTYNNVDYGFGKQIDKSEYDRNNLALFAQGRLELFDRAYITAGARHENNADFGGHTTYKIDASVWSVKKEMNLPFTSRTFASYGTSFRAPSFLELFGPFGATKTLKPERNTAYDFGSEYNFLDGKVTFKLVTFKNKFRDMIDYDRVLFKLGNLAEATSSGHEVSLSAKPIEKLRFDFAATHLRTENGETDDNLLRRPTWQYSARVTANPLEGLELTALYKYVGQRYDLGPTADNYYARVSMKSHSQVDLAARYRFWHNRIGVFARVHNLFNAGFENVRSYPAEKRDILGGVELNWQF